jgi:hypothetical protein
MRPRYIIMAIGNYGQILLIDNIKGKESYEVNWAPVNADRSMFSRRAHVMRSKAHAFKHLRVLNSWGHAEWFVVNLNPRTNWTRDMREVASIS